MTGKLLFVVQSGGFQPDVLIIPKKDFPADWYSCLKDNAVSMHEYDVDNFLLVEYESGRMGMSYQKATEWREILSEIHHFVQWGYDSNHISNVTNTTAPNWGKNAVTKSDHRMFDPLQVYHKFLKPGMEGFLFLESYDGEMRGVPFETVDDLLNTNFS